MIEKDILEKDYQELLNKLAKFQDLLITLRDSISNSETNQMEYFEIDNDQTIANFKRTLENIAKLARENEILKGILFSYSLKQS